MLTHKAIVESATTFAIEKVPLTAWAALVGGKPEDCYLYARTLGADRAGDVRRVSQAQQKAKGDEAEALCFAQWAVLGACDKKGEPFFTDADIPSLLLRPLMPLVDLANATMKLNGIIKEQPVAKEDASEDAPKAG